MFESLVAEYLDFELPDLIERNELIAQLPAPAFNNTIYSVTGVRRCGKTFYLYQLMKRLEKDGVGRDRIFFFPFDEDRIEPLDSSTGQAVLEAYFALVPKAKEGCYLFFDEIQGLPNWESFIRRVSERTKATIVITGSSSKLLSTEISTKLRGRSLSCEMWPLDFREYCLFHDIDTKSRSGAFSADRKTELRAAFRTYLDTGGFPAVQDMPALERTRMLQTYADEIVTRDVLERFGTSSYHVGRRFARTALRSTGLKFSVNKQVNALRSAGLSLSNETAYKLLDGLEDAHLIFKVANYSRSIRDNPKSAYKVYAVDAGLSYAVAPASHLDLGQRLETAVFIELKRRFGENRDDVIASYSTPKCPEVDFIVGDIALERSYELIQVAVESGAQRPDVAREASKKYASEVGNLEVAMKQTDLATSTLITLEEEDTVHVSSGTVRIVPAWRWFLEKDGQH
ncbi:MAG: ATP-binding protein [Coriobacteriales bacterium]|jgi:predicted AAA+ superfamily ATPase